MDEQVGLVGEDLGRLAGRGVAGEDDAPAAPRLAQHLFGRDAADRLPRLQPAEVGAGCDAEARGGLGVEAPGPVVLGERIAVGGDAVVDRERRDRVAGEADLLVRVELLQRERERDAAPRRSHGVEQPTRPGGP